MEFQDLAVYQAHVTSYLELLRVRTPAAIRAASLLARDKALVEDALPRPPDSDARLRGVPRDGAIRPQGLGYPLIVKSLDEEASLGIAQASIVHDEEHLRERARSCTGASRPTRSPSSTSRAAS